jgi:hypothetical protein
LRQVASEKCGPERFCARLVTAIADFAVFRRLFHQHFDRVVQTRRSRNAELFEKVVGRRLME